MDMNVNRKLPVGISDFYEIRSKGYCYVDKTHLIGTLIDDICPSAAVLFNRPPQFGKTLALSTLRCFFDCNEKEKNRPLFEGLAVSKSERYMAQQGKYPVICLNLNNVQGDTLESFEEAMKEALQKAIEPFSYLLENDKQDSFRARFLQSTFNFDVSLHEVSYSLERLCCWLQEYHGERPVLLVDGYDTPIRSAYLHGYYKSVGDYFDHLFSLTMKGNKHLRLGVIAGTMRNPKPGIMSGFNSVIVENIMDHTYADCFGFTQAEVEKVANEYAVPDKINEIQEWYGGYRFADKDIFNPCSVMRYFDAGCKPQAYWPEDPCHNLIIKDLRKLAKTERKEVQGLCEGGSVDSCIDLSADYRNLDSNDPNMVYSLMMVSGYLKPTDCLFRDYYRLTIPNKEVQTILTANAVS